MFRDYLDGDSQRIIAHRYGYSQSTVSDRIINVRENALGYAGEDAYYHLLSQKYKNVDRGGSNTDEPDFIIHDTKTVVSFKTYFDPKWNVSTAVSKLGKKEIQYAKQHNYQLHLVIYNLATRSFRTYRIHPP